MDISDYVKLQTVSRIEEWWKQRGDSQKKRTYLGGSEIGKDCERELWYSFRHCTTEDFSGRLYRLFDRGHKEEFRFVEELRGIGCEVHEYDSNGNQFEISSCNGHFKGHTDGAALGIPDAPKTWHLLEFKTSSAKEFKKLQGKGVKDAKPQHYAQMQVYMHLTGLTRALYLVVNKDNDELYGERVKYESDFAKGIIRKAERIIKAKIPPEKITERADDFRCKFCSAHSLCHGSDLTEPAVDIQDLSCRQCVHASPVKDGKWKCEKSGLEADEVCDDMLFIPDLINFADVTNYYPDQDVIEFTSKKDGTVWFHGKKGTEFKQKLLTVDDLITLPQSLVELTDMKGNE